jgi:DNA mismatch repair protein MutS2
VRRLRRRLQAAAAPLDAITTVSEAITDLEETIAQEPEPPAVDEPLPQRPICASDVVWVHPLNARGEVLDVNVGENEAEVQVGPARVRVSLRDLELRSAPPVETSATPIYTNAPPSPGMRLDLRGSTVEEALERLDQHLDAAARAALPWIHIIHGKGTGALRRAVRHFLSDHPLVSDYEAGGDKEGGEGVTVAKLIV